LGVTLDIKDMDEIQSAQWAIRDGMTRRDKGRREYL
jgi:hypothetical protein